MKIEPTFSNYRRRAWCPFSLGHLLAALTACTLLLGAAVSLQAQYTWTNGVNPNGGSGVNLWGTATSWSPNTVPNAVDAWVNFNCISNGTSYEPNVTVNGAFTVGTLYSTNSSGFIIKYGSGAETLNLQTTLTPQPLIYLGSSSGECWIQADYISGTQGFLLQGATASQKLTFRYDGSFNTNFYGPIIVGGGQLGFNTGGNFGYASSLTLSNGTQLAYENANSVPAPTSLFPSMPLILAGGGTAQIQNSGVGTLVILGPVQSPGTNNTLITTGSAAGDTTILAGTNSYTGNTSINSGTLLSSTTSTGAGSHTVAASATDGALVTLPGTSLVVSNLTLTATTAANGAALAFCPGTLGVPTAPLINVTNLLTLGNTNFTTPIKLYGGGWQSGSSIPLLRFGSVTNVYTNGLFNGFQLAALPSGITAALADGTITNQINLNVSAITPLVWSPASATANWATNGNWKLSGSATNYTEAYAGFGSAVVFDDTLAPTGSIMVTNNANVSPNSIVFNNSTHNYTLLGAGGFQNNASLTLNGAGFVTNSLNSTYLGGTFLNAGTLVLNSASALPNAGQISFGGGTLEFSANNFLSDYSGQFSTAANQLFSINTAGRNITLATGLASSGGSLNRLGTGTLLLNGASSYSGATTNAAGTLMLGVANAIPVTSALTLASSGNSAILDLAGFSQQVAGLTMAAGATAATITNSSKVSPVTLTFKGGTSTFDGIILDGTPNGAQTLGLTVAGGSLTLSGANGPNTYTGNTLITNGATLLLGSGNWSYSSTNILIGSGSTFDVSADQFKTITGGSFGGIGAVNGNVEVVAFSTVTAGFHGAVTNHGTLTFTNNLTLDQEATCALNLDTATASTNNDHIVVSGQLYANDPHGNIVYLSGPAAALATGDYTLITSPNTISGNFNPTPIWVGATTPSNAAHYTVTNYGSTVALHYSESIPLSALGSVSPLSGTHQSYAFTVVVTPGTGSTGIGVTADFGAASLGGTVQTLTGVGNTFTCTYAVPGTIPPGIYALPFTVTDAQSDTFTGFIYVTIGNGTLTWDGAAGDNNWSSYNWANGAVPDSSGDAGDKLAFVGTTPRMAPVMDTSYNVSGLVFSNNAGAFIITNNSNGGILTLADGGTVESDSANTQQLNVPITLAGSAPFNGTVGNQFKTTSGNLIVGEIGDNGAGFTKSGSGKLTVDNPCSYSGNVNLAGGTLALAGGDNILPPGTGITNMTAATLNLGGNSQTLADLEAASSTTDLVTNGNLSINTYANYYAFNGQASSSTLNMSGLSSFTFGGGGAFYINGNTTAGGQTYNLYLAAGSNYINASTFRLGAGGNSGVPTANLYLGATNIFNVATFQLGDYRGQANISFQSGLATSNSTFVLYNVDGVSPVTTMNVPYESSGGTYSETMDLGAAMVNASVNTLNLPEALQSTETGTLKFGNGTFNISTLNLCWCSAGPGGAVYGNFVQNGGTAIISTINMGFNTSNPQTNTPTFLPTYTLGNGATLNAATITGAAGVPYATNSVRNLSLSGGTLATYDYVSTGLTISGADGTSAGLVNLVAVTNTSSSIFANTNLTIDIQNTADITGSGALNITGAGIVELDGTNAHSGLMTVSAGTLLLTSAATLSSHNIQILAGALYDVSADTGYTLGSGQTLSGSGSVKGTLTTATGSVVAPGTSSIGTLTFSNNLTLGGNVLAKVNNSLSQASDLAVVLGSVSNAGSGVVTISNTGPALVAGNSFTLFNQPVSNGGALTINKVVRGGLGQYVTWQNNLANNGTIIVQSVLPLGTNAYVSSLALNPPDSLTPNFVSNTIVYYATNAYGVVPTITVTNANLTASNELILNGHAFQTLTNGVPSFPLATLGVGATNVLQVLVTAQDQVTTVLYTLNVNQIPVSTNAYLASLALNPADSLTPNFVSNTIVYYATNGVGVQPTITVADANLTSSNELVLNGVALQTLASGVPSTALTTLGAGATNVLQVLVTAQNGTTTNLYTVHLTQLAVLINTNTFVLKSSVSSNSLSLSWPPDRLGWKVQTQTNTLALGLQSNWVTLTNTASVTNYSITINPANPTLFLRMTYP